MSLSTRSGGLILAALAGSWLAGCSSTGATGGPDSGGEPDSGGQGHDGGQSDSGSPSDSGQPRDSGSPGDSGSPTDGGGTWFDGGPPLGPPIVLDAGWTWVDFPDSFCNDGSHTGIGVNASDAGTNLLIFFQGGGACWDNLTCNVLNTAVKGPYGLAQFQAELPSLTSGTTFDRTVAQNPFKDWSYVYVPYCTGDVHAGDNIGNYSGGTWYHKGHVNALAYLKRLGPTFPAPGKLVVSGLSAGGGGAQANYPFARWYWPNSESYLLDDSLPFFQGNDISANEKAAWTSAWNLNPLFDLICGSNCLSDLSLVYPSLRQHYPTDRMAVLSSEMDSTISGYYMISGAQFQTDLNSLATQVLAPNGIHTFFVNGNSHTMLGSPANYTTSTNVNLWTFLSQMVTDNPSWVSAGP
jgi:hypothetical protein